MDSALALHSRGHTDPAPTIPAFTSISVLLLSQAVVHVNAPVLVFGMAHAGLSPSMPNYFNPEALLLPRAFTHPDAVPSVFGAAHSISCTLTSNAAQIDSLPAVRSCTYIGPIPSAFDPAHADIALALKDFPKISLVMTVCGLACAKMLLLVSDFFQPGITSTPQDSAHLKVPVSVSDSCHARSTLSFQGMSRLGFCLVTVNFTYPDAVPFLRVLARVSLSLIVCGLTWPSVVVALLDSFQSGVFTLLKNFS